MNLKSISIKIEELEKDLITRMIFHEKEIALVVGAMTENEFIKFRKEFFVIKDCHLNQKSISREFTKNKLEFSKFFGEIPVLTPPTLNLIKQVKELHNAYKVYNILESSLEEIPADKVFEFVLDLQHKISSNLKRFDDDKASIQEIIKDFYGRQQFYQEKFKQGGKIIGTPTGFDKLDNVIDGLRPEHLWVLGGYTNMGKCHQKGTKILMFDGSFKNVEDIFVGDFVMGVDSKPRKVLQTCIGREKMYEIIPSRRESFIVNKSHILSLKRTGTTTDKIYGDRKGELINISVCDYLKKSKSFKHRYKLWSCGVEFKNKKVDIDPYFMGLWLGDGDSGCPRITTSDIEIENYINFFASSNNMFVTKNKDKRSNAFQLAITERSNKNKILDLLRKYNVIGNKHIPEQFLINSRKNRLNLLAGLIDTDGCKVGKSIFEFSNTNKKLAEQVCYLARTLGYHSSITKRIAKTNFSNNCISYRVIISGNVKDIPVKIQRKKIKNNGCKNSLTYSFTLKEKKIDDYYGFVLDGNHLYFTENLIVNHNTSASLNIVADLVRQGKRVVYYSLEMGAVDILQRLLGILTNQNGLDIIKGFGTDVSNELDLIKKSGLTIHSFNSEISEMIASMFEENLKQPVDLFVIDFIQLVNVKGSRSEYETVSTAILELQKTAKRFKTPIIVLSQISNDGARNQDNPVMSFKGSGSIAAAADLAIEIKSGETDTSTLKEKLQNNQPVMMKWDVRKNRHGRVGVIDMVFDGKTGIFKIATNDDLVPFN